MSGIVAGGGMPEGSGLMRWVKWLWRMLVPSRRPGSRL